LIGNGWDQNDWPDEHFPSAADLDAAFPDRPVFLSRIDGHATYERTDRGLIAVLNDLHKGRHSGPVWAMFIDLIAIACVVFAVTGLGLLWLYSRGRRVTWPLVALGLVLPFIIFLLFVHA
jgi:hypothetical protein